MVYGSNGTHLKPYGDLKGATGVKENYDDKNISSRYTSISDITSMKNENQGSFTETFCKIYKTQKSEYYS